MADKHVHTASKRRVEHAGDGVERTFAWIEECECGARRTTTTTPWMEEDKEPEPEDPKARVLARLQK